MRGLDGARVAGKGAGRGVAVIVPLLALVGLVALIAVFRPGGHDQPASTTATTATSVKPGPSDTVPLPLEGGRDVSPLPREIKACESDREATSFDRYSLGEEFEGLKLRHSSYDCDPRVDAHAVARIDADTYVYGDCDPGPDACAPPLSVQSWPACERNPALYTEGPEGQMAEANDLTVRGVPAKLFDDGSRLELYTDETTVVVFAPGANRDLLLGAAKRLTPAHGSKGSAPGHDLPQPAEGLMRGKLAC